MKDVSDILAQGQNAPNAKKLDELIQGASKVVGATTKLLPDWEVCKRATKIIERYNQSKNPAYLPLLEKELILIDQELKPVERALAIQEEGDDEDVVFKSAKDAFINISNHLENEKELTNIEQSAPAAPVDQATLKAQSALTRMFKLSPQKNPTARSEQIRTAHRGVFEQIANQTTKPRKPDVEPQSKKPTCPFNVMFTKNKDPLSYKTVRNQARKVAGILSALRGAQAPKAP